MKENCVLITGGSKGIGAATVKRFCRDKLNNNVYFIYNSSKKEAEQLEKETGAIAIKADLSNKSDIDGIIKYLCDNKIQISTLINCAGIAQTKLFTDITSQDWDNMLSVNLSSVFYLTQAIVPQMIDQKNGAIINISSIWGITGASCEVHYSTVKAAIIGFTKALAKELGPSNIRVNCVAPGVIDTDMCSNLTNEDKAILADETPLCRLGTAEEVANVIYFLASKESSFLTGQVISPNGGIVI